MKTSADTDSELTIEIEELEDRIAPYGGETVLPLGPIKIIRHP